MSIISASTLTNTALQYTADTTGTLVFKTGATPTTALTIDSTQGLTYTGTLTGGTGVVNLGSGQFYKDASGNVGIGTSSPSAKLDVAGISKAYCLRISGTPVGSFSADSWFVQNESANTVRAYVCGTNGSSFGSFTEYTATSTGSAIPARAYDNTSHVWYTNNAERMRIDSSGNLLVNQTAVANASKFCLSYSATTQNGILLTSDNTGGSAAMQFKNPNGVVGSITTSGSATAYNTSSDYRLKENIEPMTGGLTKVLALKPVTYSWKSNGSASQGFIAHELAEVVPDCVTGEKDAVDAEGNPKYQGIDTSFLVATLVAAIQELKAEFDEYKATHP